VLKLSLDLIGQAQREGLNRYRLTESAETIFLLHVPIQSLSSQPLSTH